MSHHSPPQPLSLAFIPPLSSSRVLSFHSPTPMSSRDLLLLFTPSVVPSIHRLNLLSSFFTLLHSFPPSFFFRPSALQSLNPSVFMARAHQMPSSSTLSLSFSSI